MKKILSAVVIFLFLTASQVQAAGLVPCGGDGEPACGFCDFFKLIGNVIEFAAKIAMIGATLLFIIGGGMLFFAGAKPELLQTGKNIIFSTLKGVIIIFTAFLIVGAILNDIGLAEWTKDIYRDWLQGRFFRIPGC